MHSDRIEEQSEAKMELSKAKALSTERGCKLLQYEEGRIALIELPSREQMLVSMGASSIKVFRKRVLFGWRLPTTVLSCDLSSSGWHQCIPLTRAFMSILLVDAAMAIITEASSIREIVEKYGSNFSEVITEVMNKQMTQHAQE